MSDLHLLIDLLSAFRLPHQGIPFQLPLQGDLELLPSLPAFRLPRLLLSHPAVSHLILPLLLPLLLLLVEGLQDGDDGVQVVSLGRRRMLQVVQEVRIRGLPRVAISRQARSCLLRQIVLLSVLTLMLFLDNGGRDLNRDLILLQLFPLFIPLVICSTVWTDLPDGL